MQSRTSAGSIILYCLGMAAIVVVIGVGFLRSVMRDTVAGTSSQHLLLAQSAAKAGSTEAIAAIIADYQSTSLELGVGAGGSATLFSPPTFLDGPYRAPFVSLTKPDRLRNVDDNSAVGMNDVRSENMLIAPMTRMMDHNSGGQTAMRYLWHTNGLVMYDGRGRYIEPGYGNTVRPSPTGLSPVAVMPTLFLDDTATPSRHNALFLNGSLVRVESDGSSVGDRDARKAARYRLRFALGVIDLGGHLLSNPKADMDADWTNPGNDYRAPSDRMREESEAWYNMASAFPNYPGLSGPHYSQALRWQHVFQGRGNAMNYDRHWTTSLPSTFPYMFRSQDMATTSSYDVLKHWGRFADNFGSYRLFALSPSREPTSESYYQPNYTRSGTTYGNGETKGLYRILNNDASFSTRFAATQNGGQTLPNLLVDYIHANTGPQPSWYTQQQSAKGFMNGYDGCYYPGEHAPPVEVGMLLPTPFGRAVAASAASGRKWYEGKCTTPWYINVLTAPPRVISCMLLAYLPPTFKNLRYCEENFALASSKSTLLLGSWNAISLRRLGLGGHDLFTRLAGTGFSEWPTPSADGVDPNFQSADARTANQVYPGRQWNDPDLDNLGKYIDTDTRVTGTCSHTGNGLLYTFWNNYESTKSAGGFLSGPPSGWGSNGGDWYFQRLGANGTQSYWWDIVQAAASAIAVTRATWVQYPNTVFTPSAAGAFSPPSMRDPSQYDSIKELDRLFLRQLGESFVSPGDGTPIAPIVQGSAGGTQTFTQSASVINNTIRTLVANDLIRTLSFSSSQRGMIMERVLNDFRLSFFGASPQYCSGFRPLDFDGDGKVMCSGYDSTGDITEKSLGIDRWKPVDGTFVDPDILGASGRGPTPDNWFCLAGTFYIGKSHYYRIISRGELFDNLLQRPVSDATLESVLVVDPEGNDIGQSHILFQRWHFDRYTGHMSLLNR